MNRATVWRTLGIGRTDDVSAIRRAYAARLKATDSDRDAEAFMALREARDQALRWAADGDDFADDGPEDAPPEADPALAGHHQALVALLFPGEGIDGVPTDTQEDAALETHFAALMADPRMAEIGYYGEAEAWFANALAAATPRSDVLLPAGIATFGWAQVAEIAQSPAVTHIIERAGAMRFVTEVSAPGHRLNRAWRELTRPAGEGSRRGWVWRGRVRELLALIRSRHPSLEPALDWYRVGLWETPGFGGGLTPLQWIVGAVVLLNVLRIIVGAVTDDRPAPELAAPSAYQLSKPIADIDIALESIFGADLDVATIQARNPGLYGLLETNWRIAHEEGRTIDRFTESIADLLRTRFEAALPTASYAVIAEHRRIGLDEATRLRRRSAADCAALFSGKAGQRIADPELLKRRRAAMIATLLEGDVTAPVPVAGPHQFSIDGDTFDAAARAAGSTPDRFEAALTNRGTAKEQCDARIALVETALALPKAKGLKLLRAM